VPGDPALPANPITQDQRAFVEKILASRHFSNDGRETGEGRRSRLFRFLAEKTYDRAYSLTARKVASELYGDARKAADINSDKHRLVVLLGDYYRDEGHGDPIVISIPNRHLYLTYYPNQHVRYDFQLWTDINESHGIPPERFHAFITQICDAQGLTYSERNEEVRKFAEGFFSHLHLAKATLESFFKALSRRQLTLTYENMRTLMEGLRIHKLMLDPLLSRPVTSDCLVMTLPFSNEAPVDSGVDEKFVSVFKQVAKEGEDTYGFGARYGIPEKRLASSGASFVYLLLDKKGGRSAEHQHPGDEWLYVLRGEVVVRLADSGTEMILTKGCYVHFYSEQRHSAHNYSQTEDAHALVIRFYQTPERRTDDHRQALRRRIWSALKTNPPKVSELDKAAWQWILIAAAGRALPEFQTGVPREVVNRLGLVRLLRKVLGASERVPTKARKRQKERAASLERLLWPIATGARTIRSAELPGLAADFAVFPPLMYEFLFPGVPGCVSITVPEEQRSVDETRTKAQRDDWIALGDVCRTLALDNPVTVGVDYKLPRRALACSDIAITRLLLSKGARCPPNHHPGSEMLLPLSGEVEILIEGRKPIRVVANQHIAHYTSELSHEVVASKGSAEVLVIRFYGETRPGGDQVPAAGGQQPLLARTKRGS
jgi:quercetin dioxygenase-like cupin family protein